MDPSLRDLINGVNIRIKRDMSIKRDWVYERRKHLIKQCTFPSKISEHLLENGLLTSEQCVMCGLEQTPESKMRLLFEQLSPQNAFGLYNAIKYHEGDLFEDLNKNFKKKQIVPTPEEAVWVSSHREKLVKMCTRPDRILDNLLDNGLLNDQQYRKVRTEQTGEKKMKVILELLSCEIGYSHMSGLYQAVKEEEEDLFLMLNKPLVQKPSIRAPGPRTPERNYMGKITARRVMRAYRHGSSMRSQNRSHSNYELAVVASLNPNTDTTEHNNDSTRKYLVGLAKSCQQSEDR